MFVLTFDDGSNLIEGQTVDNWDDVPKDKKIVAVALTDGGRSLIDIIGGYDFYIICYEACMAMTVSAPTPGGAVKVQGVQAPKVNTQTVYGIRATGHYKRAIQKVKGNMIAEVEAAYADGIETNNAILVKGRSRAIAFIKDQADKLLAGIDAKEVIKMEITISKKFIPLSELNQSKLAVRDGVPDETLVIDHKKISKLIWPVDDESKSGKTQ